MSREAQAQIHITRALLSGGALPGSRAVIPFPDLASYPDARYVVVSADPDLTASELPGGVELAAAEALDSLVEMERPLVVFEFVTPEAAPGRLGVRVRISASSGARRPLPLGEVIVEFTPDGELAAIDDPRVLAY